jgi:hypothetical protein
LDSSFLFSLTQALGLAPVQGTLRMTFNWIWVCKLSSTGHQCRHMDASMDFPYVYRFPDGNQSYMAL